MHNIDELQRKSKELSEKIMRLVLEVDLKSDRDIAAVTAGTIGTVLGLLQKSTTDVLGKDAGEAWVAFCLRLAWSSGSGSFPELKVVSPMDPAGMKDPAKAYSNTIEELMEVYTGISRDYKKGSVDPVEVMEKSLGTILAALYATLFKEDQANAEAWLERVLVKFQKDAMGFGATPKQVIFARPSKENENSGGRSQ